MTREKIIAAERKIDSRKIQKILHERLRTMETKARAASVKYGKEITPEQCAAVEYFAAKRVRAYRISEMNSNIDRELVNKNAEIFTY